MSHPNLRADILDAMVNVVLQRVENSIRRLNPDTSATAEEHVVGFESGFGAACSAMLDLVNEARRSR